jgi:hypothetical protein
MAGGVSSNDSACRDVSGHDRARAHYGIFPYVESRKDYGPGSDKCASIHPDIACKPGARADVHAVAQDAIVIYGRRSIYNDRSAQLRAGTDGGMCQDLASLTEVCSFGDKRCTMDDSMGLEPSALEHVG